MQLTLQATIIPPEHVVSPLVHGFAYGNRRILFCKTKTGDESCMEITHIFIPFSLADCVNHITINISSIRSSTF